nr:MAG TPA: hypothetical protein [Caudoviricetes sp.]
MLYAIALEYRSLFHVKHIKLIRETMQGKEKGHLLQCPFSTRLQA